MLFLLELTGAYKYNLYSPQTYGMDTWGMFSQESLKKHEDGKWYFEYWSYNGEYLEDTREEYEANIVLETTNIDEVISFVFEESEAQVSEIINQLKEEINKWLDFAKEYRK